MKKIFAMLLLALFSVSTWAGYGILVNGDTYFDAESAGEYEGYTQYLAHVSVKNGDQLQLCDKGNGAVWAVNLNPSSVSGFTKDNDHYNATVTGCYDFYIKLKYNADELYIGNGSNCGSGEPYAKFYITGDSALVVDQKLDKSKAWDEEAIVSTADSYTLKGLKANVRYQLKVVTAGKDWKGYGDLTGTPAAGLYNDNSGNICFRLSAAGDVVVNYTSTTFTLSGSFKAVEYMTVKFVPSIWKADDPKFAAWTWGRNGYENWSPFFIGTGDTLSAQINADADSMALVRFASEVTYPSWDWEDKEDPENDQVWNKIDKILIDKEGLTYTIKNWNEGTWEPVANYYVTGDSALVVDQKLDKEKAWNTDAIPAFQDTLVLKDLKANQVYKLKVHTGSEWKGYSDLTTLSSGLSVDGDNNIIFKLTDACNVTVVYTGTVFKVLGSFVEEFDPATQEHLKLVPYCWKNDNAKMAAFYWGKKVDGGFSNFFAGEGDTLQTAIPIAADSMVLVRFASEVTYPSWDWENKEDPDNDQVWNKIDKILIDHKGLVYTIMDWDNGTWESFVPAKYYITGDSALVVDGGLTKDKAWNAQAFKATADSYVISGLKAGVNYQLKVCPDGQLDGEHLGKGFKELTTKPYGIKTNKDNNICFSLNTAGSVTVTYTASAFTIAGDFYKKPFENRIVKLIPSEEWNVADAKFAAWTWGEELPAGEWTSFFVPISAGNDTLKATIKSVVDSIDFVRFSPKAKDPTWEQAENTDLLVWGEIKDTIDWKHLTATVIGWDSLTWEVVEPVCESFGLTINGTYRAGKKNVLQSEWLEYKLLGVELNAGDKLQVRDACRDAQWAISKYAATSYEFEIKDNQYIVAESGKYDFYLKFIPNNDEIYISKEGHYTQAVPTQCEDVLMQAFFNESYNDMTIGVQDYQVKINDDYTETVTGLGNTKWTTLTAQADEIGHYFDLVWLPPSSYGSGMGYHPKKYSDQNSSWGSSGELDALIAALHNAGSQVIADVVINHCEGWKTWCDFPDLDFGTHGHFYPDESYICKNDEVNSEWNKDNAGSCYGKASGSYDDGENWEGARDWSHDNVYVQNMFKAYLKWLRSDMKYDGFRYDKGDGFDNWHHDNYNKASGPYIAFMECYSNTDEIWRRIQGANYNLMALDFDTKWHVFDQIAGWNYVGRGNGLMGRNNGRYAVEFIDSHDWFLRSDNSNEFGGNKNSLTSSLKSRLLQANAFLLSMPGVPCVFYPHWAKYKNYLKPMIEARKAAGIHSESEVKDEQRDWDYDRCCGYQATIVGKDGGYLILCLGTKAHQSGFDGFKLWASDYNENDCYQGKDASYQIWVKSRTIIPTSTDNVTEPAMKAEKFMKDGKMYIRLGDKVYDVLGQTIK